MIKTCLLGLLLLTVANSTLGAAADVTDTSAASAFPCLVKGGYTTGVITVASSPTAVQVDAAGLQNINKAKNSFTKVALTFSTCRARDPVKQVDEFVKKISKDLFDIVYVYLGQ